MKTYLLRSNIEIDGIALVKPYILIFELHENIFRRKYNISKYITCTSVVSCDSWYLHVILEPFYSTERTSLKKYYTWRHII